MISDEMQELLEKIYMFAAPFVSLTAEDNTERCFQLLTEVESWDKCPYGEDVPPYLFSFEDAKAFSMLVRESLTDTELEQSGL